MQITWSHIRKPQRFHTKKQKQKNPVGTIKVNTERSVAFLYTITAIK